MTITGGSGDWPSALRARFRAKAASRSVAASTRIAARSRFLVSEVVITFSPRVSWNPGSIPKCTASSASAGSVASQFTAEVISSPVGVQTSPRFFRAKEKLLVAGPVVGWLQMEHALG